MVRAEATALASVAWALAATAVVASLACTVGAGREDVAIVALHTRLCEVAEQCECATLEGVCGSWSEIEPEGTFAPECLDVWLEWADELECGAARPPIGPHLCPLYHGTIPAGMPCNDSVTALRGPTFTDCGAGLVCAGGTCRSPVALDFGALGQPCDLGESCDEGLYCRDRRSCERAPGRGEPCPDRVCAAPYACEEEVCVGLPGEGEPCLRGLCASGLTCEPEGCVRKAEVGEPCFGHRECVSNNCPAGFCAPLPQPGDPCSGTLPCGPRQVCVDGRCEGIIGEGGVDGVEATCDALRVL